MTVRNKFRGNRNVDKAAAFSVQLESWPPWGDVVECEISGGSSQYFQHALGYRMNGGVVIGQEFTQRVIVFDPDTIEDAGYDPETYVGVQATGSPTGSVWVWVF